MTTKKKVEKTIKWLGVREAARRHNVSAKRIRQLTEEGRLYKTSEGYDAEQVDIVFGEMDPQRRANGRGEQTSAGIVAETSLFKGRTLQQNKNAKEYWLAEQNRLRFERESGKLVSREVVEDTVHRIGAELIIALGNLKSQIEPYLSERGTDVLDREINRSLMNFGAALRGVADQAEETQKNDDFGTNEND